MQLSFRLEMIPSRRDAADRLALELALAESVAKDPQASEFRAGVTELECAKLSTPVSFETKLLIETDSPELAKLCQEAKCGHSETERLWDAITASVQESALAILKKMDATARISAEPEFERQRRIALWEALGDSADAATFAAVAQHVTSGAGPGLGRGQRPALPVSVARRFYEASNGAKMCEETSLPRCVGTPLNVAPDGTVLRCVSFASNGASSAPLPLPSKGTVQRRASAGRRTAKKENVPSSSDARSEAVEMRPGRTLAGGVTGASSQSASVRDRIRALEGSFGCG